MWKKIVLFALLQATQLMRTTTSIPTSSFTTTAEESTQSPQSSFTTTTEESTQSPNTSTTTIITTAKEPTQSPNLDMIGKSYNQSCAIKTDCEEIFNCTDEHICRCNINNYWDEPICAPKKSYHQPCEAEVECTQTLHCSSNNTCSCDSSKYWTGKICAPKKSYHQPCEAEVECTQTLHCSNDNTCSCDSRKYWTGTICAPKKSYNQPCQTKAACAETLSCSNEHKCSCTIDQYWTEKICAPTKSYNETCQTGAECANTLNCSSKHKCTCTIDKYWTEKMCAPKKSYHQRCKAEVECTQTLHCSSDNTCMCDSSKYWTGKICAAKPHQPKIGNELADNSSFSFTLTVLNTNVNRFEATLKQLPSQSEKGTFKFEAEPTEYTIGNLTAGECYTLEVYSLINETKSTNPALTWFCTHPNTPLVLVQEISTTTISLLVSQGDGHLNGYHVFVNERIFRNVTLLSVNQTIIINGEPGSLYRIDVSAYTVYKSLHSQSLPITLNCSTAPSPPKAITVTKQTTDSISINIEHGLGKVEYFDILRNGVYYVNVMSQIGGYTHMIIEGLIPGTLYKNFTIIAVSNGVNSSEMNVPKHATEPSTPNVTVTTETTDTIHVIITAGAGVVQQYNILMDGNYYKTINITKDNMKTSAMIDGLQPGTAYNNLAVVAVSNNLKSTEMVIPHHATLPEKPKSIKQQNAGLSEVIVVVNASKKTNHDLLLVIKDFRDRSNVSTAGINSIRTLNGFIFTVSKLQIGTCYYMEVYSTFSAFGVKYVNPNGLDTPSGVCTLPKKPNSIRQTSATLTSMTFDIGNNKSLDVDITVVFKDMNNNNISSITCNKTLDRYTCIGNDFDAGNCYQACAYSVLNEKYVDNDSICMKRACTLPKKPSSVSQSEATDSSISLTVKSKYDRLSIKLLGQEKGMVNCTETDGNEAYRCNISGLNIGSCYEMLIYSVLNHRLSPSNFPIKACTRPGKPLEIVQCAATLQSAVVNVTFDKAESTDDITLKTEMGRKYNYTCNKTSSLFTCTLTELNTGECYAISAVSVLNNYESLEATRNKYRICTLPNKPTSLKQTNANYTTISLDVNSPYDSVFTMVSKNKTNHLCSKEEFNLFKCRVEGLSIGTRYTVHAFSILNERKSPEGTSETIYTRPSIPVLKFNLSTTNTRIMYAFVNVENGSKDSYKIFLNGTHTANVSYNNDSWVTIKNLVPGNYYQIQATSTFDRYESDKSIGTDGYTDPDKPSIQYLNSTTNIITILINKGDGGIGGYKIYVDQKLKEHGTYTGGKQQVQILGLIPGTRSNVSALATANKLKSKKSDDIPCFTYPSPPKVLQVIGRTNTTITLKIEPGDGSVDRFVVLVNESFHSKVSVNSTKTSMTVSSLTAGTLYEFRVKAISNNLTSTSSDSVKDATFPSPPTSIRIIEMKKDSVTIEIVKGKGRVKRFVVSVNGRDINVPASLNKDATVYTIGGLDSATTYPIKVSAVSSGAYKTELASIQMSLTTKKDPIPAAIGGVFGGCAALVVILIIVFSWRRQSLCFKKNIQKEVEQGKMNAGFEEEVELEDNRRKRPIKVSEFHRHVEMMSGNSNMGFSQEFKELGILSPKHSTDVSQIQENRPKNRYTNILPFDHSRVKLIGIEDETGSDFINANYIPGKRSKREFIATQGPLPSTKEEMWRMIWEQNVSSVVMLTQLIERGRKKCEIYWPENTNEKMFLGDIIVEVETLSHLSDYTLRTIALRLGDVERRIKHYNYISWPDMGTPKTSSNMINFVDTVRKEIQPNMNGPIIVHCSAGVGRTGTFIVMDILMQEIRSKCTHVDIFGTVLNMRNYRLNMVQTEDQYVFIHNCVRDLLDVSDDEEEDRIEEQNAYLNEPIYQNVNE